MLTVENTDNHIRVLSTSAVVFSLPLTLLKRLNELVGLAVILQFVLLQHLLGLFVVPVAGFAVLLDLLAQLPVLLKFKFDFSLCIFLLSEHHAPPLEVIESLVLVSFQVPLHQGAVAHRHLLPFRLNRPTSRRALYISQADMARVFFRLVGRLRLAPVRKFSGMDGNTSEQQGKHIEQFMLSGRSFNLLPILRECQL